MSEEHDRVNVNLFVHILYDFNVNLFVYMSVFYRRSSTHMRSPSLRKSAPETESANNAAVTTEPSCECFMNSLPGMRARGDDMTANSAARRGIPAPRYRGCRDACTFTRPRVQSVPCMLHMSVPVVPHRGAGRGTLCDPFTRLRSAPHGCASWRSSPRPAPRLPHVPNRPHPK